MLQKKALSEIKNTEKETFVLWPENLLKQEHTENISNFSKKNNLYLVFNRAERTEKKPFNSVVIIDPNGKEILKNYKIHKAPNEAIEIKKYSHNSVIIENVKITSNICYDLHYSDISKRIQNNDLLFVSVDDDKYGRFMPYLHAKDAIFRAIENRVNILTASTNGPTMFVDKYGVIKKGPLKIYDEGYLVFQDKP